MLRGVWRQSATRWISIRVQLRNDGGIYGVSDRLDADSRIRDRLG